MIYRRYPNYRFQTFTTTRGTFKKPYTKRNPLLYRSMLGAFFLGGAYMYINNIYHYLQTSPLRQQIYEKKKEETQIAELFLALPNQQETDPIEMFSKF